MWLTDLRMANNFECIRMRMDLRSMLKQLLLRMGWLTCGHWACTGALRLHEMSVMVGGSLKNLSQKMSLEPATNAMCRPS